MYGFLKSAESDQFGLTATDLDLLGKNLELVRRLDGTERGRRPSAWFTYRPKTLEAQNKPSSLSPLITQPND
jgi:hypothetical protein